jgi:hypothetical protein
LLNCFSNAFAAKISKLTLDPDLPVTFYWEECNPASVYLNPMRVEDMHTLWNNIIESGGDMCAHNFQLKEFSDLLEQLQKEEEQAYQVVAPSKAPLVSLTKL